MPPTRRKPSTTASQRAQQTLAFGPTPTNKITKAPLSSAAGTKKKHAPTEPDTERLRKSAVAAAAADISTPSPPAAPPSETAAAADDADDEYPRPPERQLEEQTSPRKSALAIRGQQGAAAIKAKDTRSEAEEKAGKVSEAQVKRYWKCKEDERIAARVHQGALGVDEKVLRHFDLSSQFGVGPSFPLSSPPPPEDFEIITPLLSLAIDQSIDRSGDADGVHKPCIGIPRMKRWKRAENLGLKPPVEVLAVLLKEEKSGNVKAERAFMEGLLTSRLAVNE